MDKKKISEIIRDYLKDSGLSMTKFAKKAGLSPGYICQIVNENNPRTGKPPNLKIDAYKKIANGMDTTIRELFPRLENPPIDFSSMPRGDAKVINVSNIQRHRIPLIGSVAGGEPICDEETDLYIDGPIKASCALRLEGDSMSPTYIDGDIIYIREQPDVYNGQIAVVFLGSECTLKHVYKTPDGLSLVSNNPKYAPINIRFDEYDYIRILGIPCGYTRLYNGATVEF